MSQRRKPTPSLQRFIRFGILALIIALLLIAELLPEDSSSTLGSILRVTALVLGLLDVAGIGASEISKRIAGEGRKSTLSSPNHDIREKLLDKAKTEWLTPVLERVIRTAPFQEGVILGMKLDGRTGDSSVHKLVYEVMTEAEAAKIQTAQVIQDLMQNLSSSHPLLVLGEPGSGKTMILLHLLQAQYEDSFAPGARTIPIMLNLSSFRAVSDVSDPRALRDLITNWVVDQLITFYDVQVERNQLKVWLRDNRILYLLDGLDEVAVGSRQTCVAAINALNQEGNVRVVISCRREVYESEQLHVTNAHRLRVANLDDGTIRRLLEPADFEGLRRWLFENQPQVPEWARKPFLLNAMMSGYQGTALEDIHISLPDPEFDTPPPEILQSYIKHKLRQASPTGHDEVGMARPPEADSTWVEEEWTYSARYLSRIARYLRLAKQTETGGKSKAGGTFFFIEELQPGFFVADSDPKASDQHPWEIAYILLSRIVGVLAIYLSVGFMLSNPLDYVKHGVLMGLSLGVLELIRRRTHVLAGARRYFVAYVVAEYLALLAVGTLVFASTTPTSETDLWLGTFSQSEMTLIAVANLFVVGLYTAREVRKAKAFKEDIQPVERLDFRVRDGLRGAAIGGVSVALIAGIAAELLASGSGTTAQILTTYRENSALPITNPFVIGVLIAFPFGALMTGAFGLFRWIPRSLDHYTEVLPNSGMWHLLRQATQYGLVIGLVTAIGFGGVLGLMNGNWAGAVRGAQNGLVFGLLTALFYGGLDLLHHLVLRTMLYVGGMAPFNYAAFLRDATERDLLREIGGSFIFAHDYLVSYFANLPVGRGFIVKPNRVGNVLGMVLLGCAVGLGLRIIFDPLMIIDPTDEKVVKAAASSAELGESYCYQADEPITIRSWGFIRVGKFVGYVSPAGTTVGLFGIPVSDTWNYVSDIPHAALMCKLDTEPADAWRQCAYSDAPIASAWLHNSYTFTAPQAGCLEFLVNDNEPEKHAGGFIVQNVRD